MTRRLIPTNSLLALLLAAIAALLLCATPASAKVRLSKLGSFKKPVFVTSAPGVPGVLVVEQPGRVMVVDKGKKRGRPFLDIRGQVLSGGEQGLLSIAFPSDFEQSGLFYAYFTTPDGNNNVSEFRASGGVADPGSRRLVLEIPHPGEANHNGGQIAFGPDGNLYIAPGDGGGAGDRDDSAQKTDSLLGKMLRIDPRATATAAYSSPSTNPFIADPGRDEILAIGLRNPFRFSFDSSSGESRIAIADVGQDRFEEINYVSLATLNGANFGWNDFEGNSGFEGAIGPGPGRHDRPVFDYARAGNRCSIIGGYVVRDPNLKGVRGRYVYGDFCDGVIRSVNIGVGGAGGARSEKAKVEMLSSFGETADGKLYATSLRGPVYRLKRRR